MAATVAAGTAIALLLAACSSTVAGQAAPLSGPLAQAAAATPTSTPTSTPASASSGPVRTSSVAPTPESGSPIDLTTPAATTVSPPGTQVAGTAQTQPTTAAPATNITVHNDTGNASDQLAKDSIADVTAFWQAESKKIFGADLPPLTGGYWSIDPTSTKDELPTCIDSPDEIRENAVYCGSIDAIVYDRLYLARITKDYSALDVAFTFAHEFGHALQKRFRKDAAKSIVKETQADCFAGVWAKSVADGRDPHFAFDAENLDRVLGDYIWEMGDPAGTDPNHQQAHGSVFDRVSAMQEGYLDGPSSCVSNFNDQRVFSADKFTPDNAGSDGKGNLALAAILQQTPGELKDFWSSRFGAAGAGVFQPPVINLDKAGADCDDKFIVSYCPGAGSIDLKPIADLGEIHSNVGDFSTVTVITLAYTRYLQDKYGSDTSAEARVCTAGAFAAYLFNGRNLLSPGDLDEAVRILVVAGRSNRLIDTGDTTAWDRLDAFRTGIFQDVTACGLK